MNAEKQVAGLGVVITDRNQNCITTAINIARYFGNVAMAEAAAVKWGLQVALRVGGTSVLLESDCHDVVEMINSRVSSMAEIFWVISEILEIKKSFQNFKTHHTHRSCNGIAHSLTKLALQKMVEFVWLDEFPAEVLYMHSS